MSVFIKINDTTAIGSDLFQWKLLKWIENKKDPDLGMWKGYAFYSTLEQLLNSWIEEDMRASDAQSIAELRVAHENAIVNLSQALAPLNKQLKVG